MPRQFAFKLAFSLTIAGIVLGFLFPFDVVHSEERVVSEYELKAAVLYKLLKFVEWPEGNRKRPYLTVGILGDDPFGDSLGILQNRTVGGRPVAVRRSHSIHALKHCDVLFVTRSESERVEGIVRTASSLNMLTVGDAAGFARRGIIINFYLQDQKLRFEINVEAAKRSGLSISSQVLKLGRVVQY